MRLSSRTWIGPAMLIAGALSLAACNRQPTKTYGLNQVVQARGMTLGGSSLDLSEDYAGRPVLLNVWASWCGPCKLELPELKQLRRTYKSKGLAIVGINVDTNNQQSRARAVRDRFALPFPSVADAQSSIANQLGATALPTTVLLDRQHRIVWRHQGLLRADHPLLKAKIEAVLSEPKPNPPKQ